MSFNYLYFGSDTLTSILVCTGGRGAWRRWSLMDHEGPFFRLEYLGYPRKRCVYLPPDLLEILYERFAAANPSGAFLHSDFSEGEAIALERYSEETLDELYDQRKVLFSVNVDLDHEGYPHMRTYLPELFEPSVIERLANDPWLDLDLFGKAQELGVEKGGISPYLWVDRAARWSPEWREYCDKLPKVRASIP